MFCIGGPCIKLKFYCCLIKSLTVGPPQMRGTKKNVLFLKEALLWLAKSDMKCKHLSLYKRNMKTDTTCGYT